MLSKSERTFSILRMQELTPSIALELLKSGMRIRTIALITVVKTAIWPSRPHQLDRKSGQQGTGVHPGVQRLLRQNMLLNIGAGANPLDDLACFITHGHSAA